MEQEIRKFATTREFAKMKILSESQTRKRIHQGKCPGFQVGNRFMINVPALIEMLEQESMEAVKE